MPAPRHLHILGICGTFMGGVARLARDKGIRVSGSDANTYPPMSTQLEQLDVELFEGYSPENIPASVDTIVVGNTISRGNPELEEVLDRGLPYTSGAQWLAETILRDRWVLAVAGTHGKTTTASLLAWILEDNGLDPGFLIGGVPDNFGVSARTGRSRFFVIEADEYDTAFFDKRSKFVHYRPTTCVLNNLEFDHADIFDSIDDIKRQFSHLLRVVPASGRVIANRNSPELKDVIDSGCWSTVEYFDAANGTNEEIANWTAHPDVEDCSRFSVRHQDVSASNTESVQVQWSLIGRHNMENGLAAVAAACHTGIGLEKACASLTGFASVKRRLEHLGSIDGVEVYDDFAHHPTAIAETLAALRSRVGDNRILAVLEPRSNTMKQGIHKHRLKESLDQADQVYFFRPGELEWDTDTLADEKIRVYQDTATIIRDLKKDAKSGDSILIMSNGGFENLHQRLLSRLSSDPDAGQDAD